MNDETGSAFTARVLGLLPWEPPTPKRGPRFGTSQDCWLCGGPTGGVGWPKATAIAPTFTNHNLAAAPWSDAVCQACVATSSGETWKTYTQAHPEMGLKAVHPLSWRSYSHVIWAGGHECPTKATVKQRLLDPPPPPFLFVVALSGQKHLLFRAHVATDRDRFPVQLEEEWVLVDRLRLATCLADFERLLALGCRRDAIFSSHYSAYEMMAAGVATWRDAEVVWAPWRREPGYARLAHLAARPPEAEEQAA